MRISKTQLETLNEELETLDAQARELEQTIARNVADDARGVDDGRVNAIARRRGTIWSMLSMATIMSFGEVLRRASSQWNLHIEGVLTAGAIESSTMGELFGQDFRADQEMKWYVRVNRFLKNRSVR